MSRRLAAILAADVVGYSSLMHEDEASTLAMLRGYRAEVFDPIVAGHDGRVVKLMGDGTLVEFPSIAEAVAAALEIQQASADRNGPIQLRIGIHFGDVIPDGDDIYGQRVNVAARLEGLAEPGGICISSVVRDNLGSRIAADFADAGLQRIKGLPQPIQVWRWHPEGRAKDRAAGQPRRRADKPVIVVSPFRSLSEDPTQAYFAEGICEDVETGLSRNSALVVVANGVGPGGGAGALGAQDARDRFGAQFLLEGSVRLAGRRARVTAQLIETGTGARIWAERFDRATDDLFELQDEIVGSIVHALGAADGVIEQSERRKRVESSAETGSAYDYYLRGRHHFYKHGDSGFEAAEQLYLQAIESDREFSPAYSALAWLYFVQFKAFRKKDFDEIRPRAVELALRALELSRDEFRAHWVLGGIYLHDGRHDQSLAEFDKAVRINPNDANLLCWSAEALIYAGRLDAAVERCDHALRINPNCPDWYYWIKASALFHQGNYADALAALNRMTSAGYAGKLKAAVYAWLGDDDSARSEAREFMKLVPTFSIGRWAKSERYADPRELDRYVEGLRRAGLPD